MWSIFEIDVESWRAIRVAHYQSPSRDFFVTGDVAKKRLLNWIQSNIPNLKIYVM